MESGSRSQHQIQCNCYIWKFSLTSMSESERTLGNRVRIWHSRMIKCYPASCLSKKIYKIKNRSHKQGHERYKLGGVNHFNKATI